MTSKLSSAPPVALRGTRTMAFVTFLLAALLLVFIFFYAPALLTSVRYQRVSPLHHNLGESLRAREERGEGSGRFLQPGPMSAGGGRSPAFQDPRVEHLIAALVHLIPNEGASLDAVERALDILLLAGSIPSDFPAYNVSSFVLSRPVRVVQFGANTGTSANDPVYHRLKFTGGVVEVAMVEPVPHLFKNLSETYVGQPNVRPLWGAVCPEGSGDTAPFFAFLPNATAYNYWNERRGIRQNFDPSVFQIGSFIKRFLWHNCGGLEEEVSKVIEVVEVPCLTLPKIMCRLGWDYVDYVHIDAEGYDDKVVLSSQLETLRPFIVRLEAQHIEGTIMINYLENLGYKVLKVTAHGVLELVAIWANLKSLPPSPGLHCTASA